MNKLAVLVGCSLTLAAQDARQIVEEVQRRGHSKTQHYEGSLQVIDARGRTAEKRWAYDRFGSYGNSKVMLRFTAPAEVKGVALLVVNHPDRASDQWMWRPAIARDQRIALQDRSTRFFGTDFSFEDLEERDAGQYDYRMLGEEAVDGVPCWKIESKSRQAKSSQYTNSILWVSKERYVYTRIDNLVRENLARRLRYLEFESVQSIWTGRLLEMTDLRRNSRTRLKLEQLQYDAPMKDQDFTVQALRKQP